MAESLNLGGAPSAAAAPPCPCCAFLLDEGGGGRGGGGLFLPPGVEDAGGSDGNVGNVGEGSSDDSSSETTMMMSPSEALSSLRSAAAAAAASGDARVALVDTHGHAHLERDAVDDYSVPPESGGVANDEVPEVISLTCAVSQPDWNDALQYSSRSDRILPALGVHPWYLPSLTPDYLTELERLLIRHPRALVGEIGLCKVARFVRDYPEEDGGKSGAMEWQRKVFREQFQLAAKLRRPCTVHCVRQHGVFMSVMKQIREEKLAEISAQRKRIRRRDAAKTKTETEGPADGSIEISEEASRGSAAQEEEGEAMQTLADAFPPAIAMHSFTGTAHHVNEILKFEQSLFGDPTANADRRGNNKKKKKDSRKAPPGSPPPDPDAAANGGRPPPLFYFGFSHIVNVAMCSSAKSRRQGVEAVRAVPPSRLLAESDVHSSSDVEGGTAGSVAYLAWAVNMAEGQEGGLAEMARLTARNGLNFLNVGGRIDEAEVEKQA